MKKTQILPHTSQPELEEQALALRKNGRFTEAANLCQQIIHNNPANFKALHLLGTMAVETQQYEQGVEFLMQALEIFPLYVEAYINLGVALEKLELFEDAQFCFQKSIEIEPLQFSSYHNLASFYKKQDRWADAVSILEDGIEAGEKYRLESRTDDNILESSFTDLYFRLGLIQKEQNQIESAIRNFESVLLLNPIQEKAHFYLAELLFERLKNIYPQQLEATALTNHQLLQDRVTSNLDLDDINRIVQLYQEGLRINPEDHRAYHNFGFVQMLSGQHQAAEKSFKMAIDLDSNHAPSYSKLGDIFADRGDIEQAIHYYQEGLRVQPNDFITRTNLGIALMHKGEIEAAISELRIAIALNPDSAEVHFNLSSLLLLSGKYEEGWSEYEYRLDMNFLSRNQVRSRQFAKTKWAGQHLEGNTILVYDEQGFGDSIQFIRFLHLIEARGGKVILETSPPLYDLFQQFNQLTIVEQIISKEDSDTDLGDLNYEYYASLISLPYLFGITLDNIPTTDSYLVGRPDKIVSGISSDSEHEHKRKVGLVWAGSKTHRNDHNRSIDLNQLKLLLPREDCEFYSLQVGRESSEKDQILGEFSVSDLSSQLTDFSMTASAILQLDLIITADTAVAHLAGALGKQVWTLIPFIPDWRWLMKRSDSPWYSSMQLFRQPKRGDWESVLIEVDQTLDKL